MARVYLSLLQNLRGFSPGTSRLSSVRIVWLPLKSDVEAASDATRRGKKVAVYFMVAVFSICRIKSNDYRR